MITGKQCKAKGGFLHKNKCINLKGVINDIEKVVEYLEETESSHYEESSPEERQHHIYKSVKNINKALS